MHRYSLKRLKIYLHEGYIKPVNLEAPDVFIRRGLFYKVSVKAYQREPPRPPPPPLP